MALEFIRFVPVLLALFLLSACASHGRVKCDGHLEPINPPHAKVAPEPPK